MKYRPLGSTGMSVSEISFGAWAVGGTWGDVYDETSLMAMHRAVSSGVNFFDTADVYGDGRSERLIRHLRKERSEEIYVASKAGRRLNPHTADGYTLENLEGFIDRSLENLGVEAIDLLQLHCPPTDVYYRPDVFEALDEITRKGKIRFYGVSVERVEEALKAMKYPGVKSIQVIFNIFRQRPAEDLFPVSEAKRVGILARLPLSSGMLTGKFAADSVFSPEDHRAFNRDGAAFDKGETFSGLDYTTGLKAVEELRPLIPEGMTLAQMALKWILSFPEVSCAIPGAKTPEQAEANCAASDLPDLAPDLIAAIDAVYTKRVKPLVHEQW